MSETYIVQQGDCLSSIAEAYGHFWKTVWNHPENAKLKAARGSPDVLRAGDEVLVPELQLKQKPGATEKKHRFRRKGVPQRVVIQLKKDGEVLADQEYVLRIEDEYFSGRTDGQGRLSHPVPPTARAGCLTVGSGRTARTVLLRLGYVDPVSEISGLQGRLKNLGYDCGPASGALTEETKAAVSAFQADHELEVTGEADESTREKLRKEHGS